MPIMSTQHWLDYYSNGLYAVSPVTVSLPMLEDTFFLSSTATTNYATNTSLYVGEDNAATSTGRSWVKPDFSTIPAGATFLSAALNLTPILDRITNARTMRVHRCLRDVVVAQATWNIWKTSNNWATAGASNSSSDYDGAVELGNVALSATPTLNVPIPVTLSASELQKLFDGTYVNNGIILFVDTQTNDQVRFASTDHATAGYRPTIDLTYIR